MEENPYTAPQTPQSQAGRRHKTARASYDPLALQQKVSRRFWSIVFLLYIVAAIAVLVASLR